MVSDKAIEVAKLIEEIFRINPGMAKIIVNKMNTLLAELKVMYGEEFRFKIMNFCGTHEWTVTHFGIRSIVPNNIELVAGPGCPVCVTPSGYIEEAIKLSLEGVVVYTYGDTYRLNVMKPIGGAKNLAEARAMGGSVKVVTSIIDAIKDAKTGGKESIFIGIGFETVAPGYANVVLERVMPPNLKLMSLVKLTPPAMFYTIDILREKPTEPPIMGVIAPGHVSTITGAKAWTPVAENFNVPVVVSGFEPIDVLLSILETLRQLVNREAKVVIEYTRAVTWHGDLKAQSTIHRVFETVDDAWRGIGYLPKSGLRLRERYREYDAFHQYGIGEVKPESMSKDLPPGCRCAEITLGKAVPTQCPLFMKTCTPANPIGPCMVSVEGTCSIWAKHGAGGLAREIAYETGLT